MQQIVRWGQATLLVAALGCDGNSDSTTGTGGGTTGSAGAGTGASSAGGSGAGGAATGGATTSGPGGGGSGGGGEPCEPTAGNEVFSGYCDDVRVALIEGAGQPRVQVAARMNAGAIGCAIVDSVILGDDENNAIQTLTTAIELDDSGVQVHVADAVANSELVTSCAVPPGDNGAGRVEAFGFIARGRVDGGTFEARCGRADSGSSWPPDVVLTCHDNIENQPRGYIDAILGSDR